jgi:cation transport regulator ChaC
MLSFYEYKLNKENYLKEDDTESLFIAPDKSKAMMAISQAIGQIQPLISNLNTISAKLEESGIKGEKLKKTAESLTKYLDELKKAKEKSSNVR